MSIQLKEAEIKNILAEVTASLQAAKKSEAEKLSKALDGEESSPAGEEAPPAAESAAPAAPEASESAPAPSPDMGEGGPAADAAPAESAPAADPAASADPAAADPAAQQAPADPAALAQEYAQLDDETLKAHYMACKQAVFERMQGAQSADPAASAGGPPADASAVASPPAAGASPAMKGEVPESNGGAKGSGIAADGKVDPVTATGSQKLDQATGPGANLSAKQSPVSDASHAGLPVEKEVAKSEQVKDLEQQVEGLVKAMNLLINGTQPIRKAVTSVAVLERTEALEKSEKPAAKKLNAEDMKAHLSDLIRSGKLNKNEKAAVLSFYETKNPAHLEKIAHLFE